MRLEQDKPRHPTLGLLVDCLEDDYQNAVRCGAADAARRHEANLICFAGGVLCSPEPFATQRNVIYELAGSENRFHPLPMCSIVVPLPGVPSVLVDNATGTREVLAHLSAIASSRCWRRRPSPVPRGCSRCVAVSA